MIIETINQHKLGDITEDPDVFDAVNDAEANIMLTKAINNATKRQYIGGEITAYQQHKLTSTQWKPAERSQQTYPQGFTLVLCSFDAMMAGGWGMHVIASGALIEGMLSILGGILVLLMGVAIDIPVSRTPLHNALIKRADIDHLKLYSLDGPVMDYLQIHLGNARYNRMIDWLRQDISSDLHREFIRCYDKVDIALESIAELEGSTVDQLVKNDLLSRLYDKVEADLNDVVLQINGVFDSYDSNAEQVALKEREAAQAKQIVAQEQANMDESFLNDMIIQKANFALQA